MNPMLDVIFEDGELLVVRKPAGLVCHPTKGDVYSSLISRVRLHLQSGLIPGASPESVEQPQLVNRLDRETSGVTLIGKTAGAARELRRLFENRTVQKEYVAIVHGRVAADSGTIDAPLGKDEKSVVAIKDCVRADGKAACTDFVVKHRFLRSIPGNTEPKPFTLVGVSPRTGRKHQIRIHLAHLGNPIVGDKIYGGDETIYLALVEGRLSAAQSAALLVPHHALHAGCLRFAWQGCEREFRAEPEPWFTEFLP
ncbi:MAG: RluA family pseudouridine synthase [Verrucomicrobia bacterium]|nr:RluA family pseudouridine synthase [Verrucomicrobiota bacterium]